ncbi:MAG: hypothetical protein HY080_12035, partial [Gammaproteobacteria bacterium]|nr:hypothetical protein [Gammaproteobacteria bacterium]
AEGAAKTGEVIEEVCMPACGAGVGKMAAGAIIAKGSVKLAEHEIEKQAIKEGVREVAENPGVFKSVTTWKATGKGTGNTYKVYQQEIDWKLVVRGETNLERAKRGVAPYVMKDGKAVEIHLHHSRQNAQGPLYELSKTTHQAKKEEGREALHPYGSEPHPDFPVDRDLFKKEPGQYWIDRAKGVKP